MKQLTYIVAALIIGLTSCTKVIDVNFDDAPSKVVIEGIINNNELPTVKLSKTVEADQNNVFPPLTGATVTINDDAGNTETLQDMGNGVYNGNVIIGTPGNTYTLTVIAEGTTYTSQCKMPALVPVDSLSTRTFSGFGDGNDFVVVHYVDPETTGNNYRAVLYINDELVPEIFIEDDVFINGNVREAVLFSGEYELIPGDKIRAEINCIDKPVYDYLLELIEVSGSSDVASPSNPVTNIEGGALGFFTAQTSSVVERDYE